MKVKNHAKRPHQSLKTDYRICKQAKWAGMEAPYQCGAEAGFVEILFLGRNALKESPAEGKIRELSRAFAFYFFDDPFPVGLNG